MAYHFILVHGAWHGGWCWDGVRRALAAHGHHAEAPTLPSHQPKAERAGVRFEDYVEVLVNALHEQPEPVVLVGHSSAGFSLQVAAPLAAAKIAQLVFINAFVLPDGKSQFDLIPSEAAEGLSAAAVNTSDNTVPVIEDFVRDALMVGDPEGAQDELLARLVPQPLALFTTPVATDAFAALVRPKAVIYGTRDASLPPGAYRAMAETLGEYTLIKIDGSHEALYTEPAKVAAALLEVVQRR